MQLRRTRMQLRRTRARPLVGEARGGGGPWVWLVCSAVPVSGPLSDPEYSAYRWGRGTKASSPSVSGSVSPLSSVSACALCSVALFLGACSCLTDGLTISFSFGACFGLKSCFV